MTHDTTTLSFFIMIRREWKLLENYFSRRKKKMIEALMEKIESWLLRWKKRLICRGFRKEFASSRYFRACHKSRNTYFELDMPYFRLGLKFVSYILLVILHLAFTLNYNLYCFPHTCDELVVNDIEERQITTEIYVCNYVINF